MRVSCYQLRLVRDVVVWVSMIHAAKISRSIFKEKFMHVFRAALIIKNCHPDLDYSIWNIILNIWRTFCGLCALKIENCGQQIFVPIFPKWCARCYHGNFIETLG